MTETWKNLQDLLLQVSAKRKRNSNMKVYVSLIFKVSSCVSARGFLGSKIDWLIWKGILDDAKTAQKLLCLSLSNNDFQTKKLLVCYSLQSRYARLYFAKTQPWYYNPNLS